MSDAGCLIEYLANPAKFLEVSKCHLKPGGRLLLTTLIAFNLFALAKKPTKSEPAVNPDHVFHPNPKIVSVLLEKTGFSLARVGWIYHHEFSLVNG